MSIWDPEKALEMARKAYTCVGRILPPDVPLEAIRRVDRRALDAEVVQGFPAYEEALGELCRATRAVATRRAA